MSRKPLPFRRHGITQRVSFKNHSFDVTFGVGDDGTVQEAFMRSTKEGSDLSDLLRDGCILFSLLLQHGEAAAVIANALGENRGEGDATGPESSAIGSIARAAAVLDVQLSSGADGALTP
jgi:hypothetical protein